jgi:hypothetical protein
MTVTTFRFPNTFTLPHDVAAPNVTPAAPSVTPFSFPQDLTVAQEPMAAPLTGLELTRIVQGGASAQTTLAAIAALAAFPFSLLVRSTGGTLILATNFYGDIAVNTAAALTINLPDSTARAAGVSIGVIDVFGAPAITIVPFGSQKIMGLSSLALTTSFGSYALWPLTSGGWYTK